MDDKKNTDNGEYQFIREKIISKKKNRVKRVLLITVGTLFLAVLFGFVARLVFIKSEGAVNKLLGFTPTPTATVTPTRTAITIPPATEKPTNSPTPLPTPTQIEEVTPTEAPSATPTEVPATPTPTPTEAGSNPVNELIRMYGEFKKIAGTAAKSMVQLELVAIEADWFGDPLESVSTLAGILIGDNGEELFVLVPAAAVLEADRIDITIGATKVSDIKLVTVATEYDYAMLSVNLGEFGEDDLASVTYATFGDSSKIEAGSPVIAVGCPNGYMGAYDIAMVTNTGIYAYVTDDRIELMNTNMPENVLTNGAFINMSGEVVGIITHDHKDDKNATCTTMVAIDSIKNVIGDLANCTSHTYLGVVAKETPSVVLERLDLDYGLYVTEVKAGSPAEIAGIKKGDIMLSIDGQKLVDVESLRALLDHSNPMDRLDIELIRNSQVESVSAMLLETDFVLKTTE